VSKKSNVHPDYYKTAGRDRQDDAAAARFVRAIAAKASSQERSDRMAKGPYFQRPEPTRPASGERVAKPAQRKSSSRAGTAKKKTGVRPASGPSRPASTRKAPPKTRRTTARHATRRK
jgi:hypothetical protein